MEDLKSLYVKEKIIKNLASCLTHAILLRKNHAKDIQNSKVIDYLEAIS